MRCLFSHETNLSPILWLHEANTEPRLSSYNARIISYNQEILLIRPKLSLANDGNYREMRYFSPWKGERVVEDFYLPRIVAKLQGQKKCRIGDA
jgi:predicted amidohydrolase